MSTDDFWRMPIGIPRCWQHDYDAFRAIFEDAHSLPATWEEFIQIANEAEQHYEDQGHPVFRVYIDLARSPLGARRTVTGSTPALDTNTLESSLQLNPTETPDEAAKRSAIVVLAAQAPNFA